MVVRSDTPQNTEIMVVRSDTPQNTNNGCSFWYTTKHWNLLREQ